MKTIFLIALLVLSAQAGQLDSFTQFVQGIEDETGLDLGPVIECFDEQSATLLLTSFTQNFKAFQETGVVQQQNVSPAETEVMMKVVVCMQGNKEYLQSQLMDFVLEKGLDQVKMQGMQRDPTAMISIANDILQSFESGNYYQAGITMARGMIEQNRSA